MNIDIGYIAIVIGVILFSMTFHEAMHAYTSYWLGDNTAKLSGRLSLNPLKHIDPFLTILLPLILAISGLPVFGGAKPVPYNPNNVKGGEWGAAMIAIAGPLTNFILAFVFFGIWATVGLPQSGIWSEILSTAVFVNLGFFIFNLLPIPPLDGSRVLYALAPDFVRKGMEVFEPFGIVVIFALILLSGSSFSELFVTAIKFFLNVFTRIYTL